MIKKLTQTQAKQQEITRATNEDFRNKIAALITADTLWDFEKAYITVLNKIITKLPGEAWNKSAVKV